MKSASLDRSPCDLRVQACGRAWNVAKYGGEEEMANRRLRFSRHGIAIAAACLLVVASFSRAPEAFGRRAVEEGTAEYPRVDPAFLSALQWRLVGPFRGGRAPAVVGDPNDPMVFYMATAHGGVWKTVDAGANWRNVTDRFFDLASVGAVDVSRSNSKIVYVGTGEGNAYQHTTPGDGVWKSIDGGDTWTKIGLANTKHIARIVIDPTNPDIVYVAARGDIYGTNPDRGIFRTKDGGRTWERVLYKSDKAGAIGLSMDAANSNILIASLNEYARLPWDEVSGGPDSGIYKTTDGGTTWSEITRSPGLPKGVIGKSVLAISPARPTRYYAMIEANDGGLFRSDDSGSTWTRVSADVAMLFNPMMYFQIAADTGDADTLYVLSQALYKSTDGGRTFTVMPMRHADHHQLWIDPSNPKRMIDGGDGGGTITLDGGLSWSTIDNQPTSELFSLAIDDQDPYWLYAAQNDNSHIAVPSRSHSGAIGWPDVIDIGGGEGGRTAVKPDGSVVYACDRTAMVRWERKTGRTEDISVWPENEFGAPVKDVKYRFYYTFPVMVSSHDPNVIYTAAQYVFRSSNEGMSWDKISGDLTRNRQDKMQELIGRPLTTIESSLYYVSTIRTIAESPLKKGELWISTDDSTVQMSPDGGKTWKNVSPPDLPEWSTILALDVSHHAPGTVYLAAERHRVSDLQPYLYKTTDYGKTWQKITNGIAAPSFTYVIREDPIKPGLLFAGTETGVYVSFDDGAAWQSLRRNMPPASANNMLVKNDDLVVATSGRGFWILDNISALRQITPEITSAPVHLFTPRPAIRQGGGRGTFRSGGTFNGLQYVNGSGTSVAYQDTQGPDGVVRPTLLDGGQNPPAGAMLEYYLSQVPSGPLTLSIIDAGGHEVRRFSNQSKDGQGVPARAGMNRFVWDLRYAAARSGDSAVPLPSISAPRSTPPIAPPGRYIVRLTDGSQTYEERLDVGRDPNGNATDADLQAQFDLAVQIRDTLSLVNDGLRKVHEAEQRLEKLPQSDAATPQVKSLQEKLHAIEGELTRLPGRNPMYLPPKALDNKLSALSSVVSGREGRPTKQMYDVFQYLSQRADSVLAQLKDIVDKELSKVAS
jgi:photosystem II stability/assembly factor-like uncharacterized protein